MWYSNTSINVDLQNTFDYLENDKDNGFIINFEQTGNSSIIQSNDYIPKIKSSGISTGSIIAIILPCIFLLLLAVGLVFSLRNRVANSSTNPPLQEIANNINTVEAIRVSSEVVVNQ